MNVKCPYCGAKCESVGGEDGNPYNRGRAESFVCTSCGRTVPAVNRECSPLAISDEDLQELMTDADLICADTDEISDNVLDTEEVDITLADITDVGDGIMLKITATAEAAGVKRCAETLVPLTDGIHSLSGDYPFGRRDADQKPPFSLSSVSIDGDGITVAGETFTVRDLPRTVTKKLTAYGYGYVPWVETVTVTVALAFNV